MINDPGAAQSHRESIPACARVQSLAKPVHRTTHRFHKGANQYNPWSVYAVWGSYSITVQVWFSLFRPFSARFDWVWIVLARFDRFWTVLARLHWFWTVLVRFDSFCTVLDSLIVFRLCSARLHWNKIGDWYLGGIPQFCSNVFDLCHIFCDKFAEAASSLSWL